MATITAPSMEVTQVVTGYMYQLAIAEEENGAGITRIDIGPYFFNGVPPRVQYPEAVTTEMVPPGWEAGRWFTDAKGATWLRFPGGVLRPDDGEQLFQFTSNYAAADDAKTHLVVWHGPNRSETYDVPVPDYTRLATLRNPRHDSQGLGRVYKQTGCLPQLVIGCGVLAGLVWHLVR